MNFLIRALFRLFAISLLFGSAVCTAATPEQVLQDVLPSLDTSVQDTVNEMITAGESATTVIASIADDISPKQFESIVKDVSSGDLSQIVSQIPSGEIAGIIPNLSDSVTNSVVAAIPSGAVNEVLGALPTDVLSDVISGIEPDELGEFLDGALEGQLEEIANSVLTPEVLEILPAETIDKIFNALPEDVVSSVIDDIGPDVLADVLEALPSTTLDNIDPGILAEVVSELPIDQIPSVLETLPTDVVSEIFETVNPNDILGSLPIDEVTNILDGLPVDQITSIVQGLPNPGDILGQLPQDIAGGVLAQLPAGEIVNIINGGISIDNASSIISLLPPDLAGGVLGQLPNAAGIINNLINIDPGFLGDLVFSGFLPPNLASLIPDSILGIGGFGGAPNQVCSAYTAFSPNALSSLVSGIGAIGQIDSAIQDIDGVLSGPLGGLDSFLTNTTDITNLLGPLGDVVGNLSILDALPLPDISLGGVLTGLIPDVGSLVPGELLTIVSQIQGVAGGASIGGISAFGLFGAPITAIPILNPLECRSNAGSSFANAEQFQMVQEVHREEVVDAMVAWGLDPAGIDWATLETRFADFRADIKSAVDNYEPNLFDGNAGMDDLEWMTTVVSAEMSSLIKCQFAGPLSQFDPECMDFNFGEVKARPRIKIPLLFGAFCFDWPSCFDLGVGYNMPKELVWTRPTGNEMMPKTLVKVLEPIRNESLKIGDHLLAKIAIWMNLSTLKNDTVFSAADFWEFYDDPNINNILDHLHEKREDFDLTGFFPHEDLPTQTFIPQFGRFAPGCSWYVQGIAGMWLWCPLLRVNDDGPPIFPLEMTLTGPLALPQMWKSLAPRFADLMTARVACEAGYSEVCKSLELHTLGATTQLTLQDARGDTDEETIESALYREDTTGFTNDLARAEYGGATFDEDDVYSPTENPSLADGSATLGVYGRTRVSSFGLRYLQEIVRSVRNNKYEDPAKIRCSYDFRDYCPRPGQCDCEFGKFSDVKYQSGGRCHIDSIANIGDPIGDLFNVNMPSETRRELAFIKDYEIADDLDIRTDLERFEVSNIPNLLTHRHVDVPEWDEAKAAVAFLPLTLLGDPGEILDITLLEIMALNPLICGVKRCDDEWKFEPAESRCESTGRFDPDSPLGDGFSGSCC